MKKLLLTISIIVFATGLHAQTKNVPAFVNADAASVVNFDAANYSKSLPDKIMPGNLYLRVKDDSSLNVSIGPLTNSGEPKLNEQKSTLNGQTKNFYIVGDMLTLEVCADGFGMSFKRPFIIVLKLSEKDKMEFILFEKKIPMKK